MRHARDRALDAPHLPIAGYLGYVGLATLIGGTPTLDGVLPVWLTYAWSLAVLVGAVLVIAGVLGAWTRAESAGHGFHLFGIGLFTVVAVAEHQLDAGAVSAVLMLAAVSGLRMRLLTRAREAREEANRYLRGERR